MSETTTEVPTHVKLSVDGESFWAIPLPERGPDVYRIDNILLSNDYCFGDIVRADSNGAVSQLIERAYDQWAFNYPVPKIAGTDSVDNDLIEKNWKIWRARLKEIDVYIEGVVFGTCTVAYPKTWSTAEAKQRITNVVPEFSPFNETAEATTMTETEKKIKGYLQARMEECAYLRKDTERSAHEQDLWAAREEALRGVYDTFFKERT